MPTDNLHARNLIKQIDDHEDRIRRLEEVQTKMSVSLDMLNIHFKELLKLVKAVLLMVVAGLGGFLIWYIKGVS